MLTIGVVLISKVLPLLKLPIVPLIRPAEEDIGVKELEAEYGCGYGMIGVLGTMGAAGAR